MTPSLLLSRTILISRSRDTTCRSPTLIFCAPRREHPPAAWPAVWCRELREAESAASAAERREQAPAELRAGQAAREVAPLGWFSPPSVPARRSNPLIPPSTET